MMNKKRAANLGFKCPACRQSLHPIERAWGCLNLKCFDNFYQVAYRVKLGLIPKNRL